MAFIFCCFKGKGLTDDDKKFGEDDPQPPAPETSDDDSQAQASEIEEDGDSKSGTLTINTGKDYLKQHIFGFGGSLAFYTNFLVDHDNSEAIYDAIFGELRPSVIRIRNSYDQHSKYFTAEESMKFEAQIVKAARKRLPGDLEPKIMMSSWTPPAKMKVGGRLQGDKEGDPLEAVLKKNTMGKFIYRNFAEDYWLKSLQSYEKLGIKPRWISIQNEPDYNTDSHDTCVFKESETYEYPSYYRAFDTVYDTLHRSMADPPGMIGPESYKFEGFLKHPFNSTPRMEAIGNHLYGAGAQFDNPRFFPNLDNAIEKAKTQAELHGVNKVFMTEYANLQNHKQTDPLTLARTIHKCLTKGKCGMYLNWDLAWASNTNEGSLLLIDTPSKYTDGSKAEWKTEEGFARTQSFYWFRHFTCFVRPGMRLASTSGSQETSGVLSLAFSSENNTLTVIMINTEERDIHLKLEGLPDPPEEQVYRKFCSTFTEPWVEETPEKKGDKFTLNLPATSITTLYSGAW